MESVALVMGVISPPTAASSSSNSISNNTTNQANVNNLLGQSIITLNDHTGSIKQLLSSLNDSSTQQLAMQQFNGFRDDAPTNSNPSVIDSIASLLALSGQ